MVEKAGCWCFGGKSNQEQAESRVSLVEKKEEVEHDTLNPADSDIAADTVS